MRSNLTPDSATVVGLLSAAGVYLIYSDSLPTIADARTAEPHNADLESARKAAAWKSAALLTIVFVVARDINSYIISGVALVGIDYMHKHANAVHPMTGKVDTGGGGMSIAPDLNEYAMPDYSESSVA